MAGQRRSVLLLAESANPEWTSVPLIGWSLYRALSKVADVHLVTQIRNRHAIIRAGLIEGRDFSVIDNEHIAAPLHRISNKLRGGAGKGWTTSTAISSLVYYSFECSVWRQFKSRIAGGEFDIVHRITPLTPTSQSILARRLARLGVPFVIGPLNGGVPWPKGFTDRRHAEREWLSRFRWLYKLMPGYRSTRRFSAAIIVGSQYTFSDMPSWARRKCVYIPENAVDPERFTAAEKATTNFPMKAAFVGRLVPYKGADILLEATMDFLKEGKLEIHIVGDGPQRKLLEGMVDRLTVGDNVHFHGWIPHSDVQNILKNCDFMALPSVREFGGGVVIEAMAVGVPPIVANYAGPSELIDETTGIRVPFGEKQSLVEGMKREIGKILQNPRVLDKLGAAGRRRVAEKFTWQAKADQIAAIYEAVLKRSTDLGSLSIRPIDWD